MQIRERYRASHLILGKKAKRVFLPKCQTIYLTNWPLSYLLWRFFTLCRDACASQTAPTAFSSFVDLLALGADLLANQPDKMEQRLARYWPETVTRCKILYFLPHSLCALPLRVTPGSRCRCLKYSSDILDSWRSSCHQDWEWRSLLGGTRTGWFSSADHCSNFESSKIETWWKSWLP